MATYRGFNTINRAFPPWGLTDINLVKQDLLNHFMTRKGERVMLPEFGSIIHDLLYDPFDEITKDNIVDDVERVVGSEPRVQLVDMDIVESEHGIAIQLQLFFVKQDTADHLLVNFERDIREDF